MLERRLFPHEAWDEQLLAAETTHPDRVYLAIEDPSGRLDGYGGVMINGEDADLHTIGVLRPGRGLGRTLLAALVHAATARGARRLLLEVRVDNERAIDLYQRNGFTRIGIRPRYYRTPRGPVDALVMERDLRAPRRPPITPDP